MMNPHAIAAVLSRSPRSLPRRLKVEDHRAGSWDLDALLDALAILAGDGTIAGYDGEDAAWTGNGYITLWVGASELPVELAA